MHPKIRNNENHNWEFRRNNYPLLSTIQKTLREDARFSTKRGNHWDTQSFRGMRELLETLGR